MINAVTAINDEDAVVVENVMKATGLTHDQVVELLMTDKKLDATCEVVLANLSTLSRPTT